MREEWKPQSPKWIGAGWDRGCGGWDVGDGNDVKVGVGVGVGVGCRKTVRVMDLGLLGGVVLVMVLVMVVM